MASLIDAMIQHKEKLSKLGWVTPSLVTQVVSSSLNERTRIERKYPDYYKKKLTGVTPKG